MWVGIAVLVTNGAAGVWGGIAWLRKDPSIGFWYVLRAAQGAVVLQVVIGFVLVASGENAPDGLHMVYGVAPLLITLISEALRIGAAQQELEGVEEDLERLDRAQQIAIARRVAIAEMGVMTIGALMILTLALRAYQTGG